MDRARVEHYLAGGMTLTLSWEKWRRTHPDGMGHLTWCCRFRNCRISEFRTIRCFRQTVSHLVMYGTPIRCEVWH